MLTAAFGRAPARDLGAPRSAESRLSTAATASVLPAGVPGTGDANHNGRVDLADFALWAGCMLGPAGPAGGVECAALDFDGGGQVDLRDAAVFARQFDRLLNDDCPSAVDVVREFTDFSNRGATTDGLAAPGLCSFAGSSQIFSDIWYRYTATCSGDAVLSLCGSEYDTKLAIYPDRACPPAVPLACSDDDCSAGTTDSRVALRVTAGQTYLVRVGGVPGPLGEQGHGTLTISCGVSPCGGASGDCFSGNGSRGCNDPACCETVCRVD
ncbi:MAG: hypothetical protein ACE5EX_05280, partial [Phycisphaerae bacterium]